MKLSVVFNLVACICIAHAQNLPPGEEARHDRRLRMKSGGLYTKEKFPDIPPNLFLDANFNPAVVDLVTENFGKLSQHDKGEQLRIKRGLSRSDNKNKYLTHCERKALKKFSEIASSESYYDWLGDVTSYAPVLFPTSISQLQSILGMVRRSSNPRCHIRVRGGGQSYNGMVVQRRERNVIVVSLLKMDISEDYPDWDNKLDDVAGQIKMKAGDTFFEMMSIARPEGWLLHSRTAGWGFTIGGTYLNMVHGANDFLHAFTGSILVMFASGEVEVISDEEALKYWRSSQGLLGILISVTWNLKPDNGFEMFTRNRTYGFQSQPAAALINMVNNVYSDVSTSEHAQFFFSPWSGQMVSLLTRETGVPYDGTDPIKRAQYEQAYAQLLGQSPDEYGYGFTGHFQVPLESPCDLVPPPYCLDPLSAAIALSSGNPPRLAGFFEVASASTNDGFYLTSAVKFDSLIMIVPAEFLPQALGTYLGVFGEFATNHSLGYIPNGVFEFRFLNSTETAVLNPVPTIQDFRDEFASKNGFYPPVNPLAGDNLVIAEFVGIREVYGELTGNFLFALQEKLLNTGLDPTQEIVECNPGEFPPPPCNPSIGIKIAHFGKGYSYGSDPETTPYSRKLVPFADEVNNGKIFGAGKKDSLTDFETYRVAQDPNSLFSGGAMMGFLDPTNYPNSDFEPRHLVGESCGNFLIEKDRECLDECCDVSGTEVCLRTELKPGSTCKLSCQCIEGFSCVSGKCKHD